MNPVVTAALIQYGLMYGPQAVLEIISVFEQSDPTLADIKAAFSRSKESAQAYKDAALASAGFLRPKP